MDKKNQLDVTFVFFISLLLVAQHVSGNHIPIIRSWRLRDAIVCYIAGSASMDALPANRSWQPSCSHGTYQHETIATRSRQLLMMGTWLPETCWATSRREIKNTKVTSSWFFLSTLNYDARSTTPYMSSSYMRRHSDSLLLIFTLRNLRPMHRI